MAEPTPTDAASTAPSRLFVSYGRDDDEPFVKRLVADLQARGIAVWWDRQAMDSRGRSFLQEIRDAIASECDRLLFVVGPQAVTSAFVAYEWEHALKCCKVVLPIVRSGDPAQMPARLKDAGYNLLPSELALFHSPDFRDDAQYDARLQDLCSILQRPTPPPGRLHGVPAQIGHLLQRPPAMRMLHDSLLRDLARPVVIAAAGQAAALQGMGGIGKSVLAATFAHACRSRRAFHQGVFWLSFGQNAGATLEAARQLGLQLDDAGLAAVRSPADLEQQLARALGDRACLLVLDDIWQAAQALPFVRAAAATPRSRVLLTTRDLQVAQQLDASPCTVDLLDEAESLALFALAAARQPADLPAAAAAIVRRCAGLPLALAVVGARLRAASPGEWADVDQQLGRAQLGRLRIHFPGYAAYPHLLAALRVSHRALPAAAARHLPDLAIFDEDSRMPESVLVHLWRNQRTDAAAVRERIALLVQRSLLTRDADGAVRLHDLLRGYLLGCCRDPQAVRQRLLLAWRKACGGDWSALPDDGYSHHQLVRLMADCGADADIAALFTSPGSALPAWVQMRLRGARVSALRDDLLAAERHAAAAVQRAVAGGMPGPPLALALRVALMRASIGTVGGNLPPLMLAHAVQQGLVEANAAWDAALALPQADVAGLRHKCAVLAALRKEGANAAADDPRLALQVIVQAAGAGRIAEVHVAWALWDLVRDTGPHWLDATTRVVNGLHGDDARTVGQRHLALLRQRAGQADLAEQAALQVPLASGRGFLVGEMAALADAAALPALRRLHAGLDGEERRVAAPGIAAALWRHGEQAECLALLRAPASATPWARAVQRLAPMLAADQARELLAVARRHGDTPDGVAAQVALALRLATDESDQVLAALWQRWIAQSHDDEALPTQRALLLAWPPALWPAAALDKALRQLDIIPDDAHMLLLAPGLWQRGEQARVRDWLARALRPPPEMPLASDLLLALLQVADASDLAALAGDLDRLPDAHARERASVPLIRRLAEAGQGHAAWHRLLALQNAYFRDQALQACAPHLRGSALAAAVKALNQIGDADAAALLRTALLAAGDHSGARLAAAIDAGSLPTSHLAAQLAGCLGAGATGADALAERLRTVRDNERLATALLTVDRLAPGDPPLVLYEAVLAIDLPSTLWRLGSELAPRLPALMGGGWAEPLRQRWRGVVEDWFTEMLDGHSAEALATASAWQAWCAGAAATVERLAPLRQPDNPFDLWFAAMAAVLPFMPPGPHAHWLAVLQDLVDAEPDPYRPLVRGGDLSQLDGGLLAAMKAALAHAEFDNVRGEAAELAVLAARQGDLAFAAATAQRLVPTSPDAAMEVLAALLQHDPDARRRLQHAQDGARCAQRLSKIMGRANRRSDALALLVPGLLALDAAAMAEVLLPLVQALADAPRGEFLHDLAALAPALVRLAPGLASGLLLTALTDVQGWWP